MESIDFRYWEPFYICCRICSPALKLLREKDTMHFRISGNISIGTMVVKKELVRSATCDRLATEERLVTLELINFYKSAAKAGVGLIISSLMPVHLRRKSYFCKTAIDRD